MATYQDLLTASPARADAVNHLLRELEDVLVETGSIPSEHRDHVLAQEADKITARVSRALWAARDRLAAHPIPRRPEAS
jgi:hypothetical protein